MNKALKSIATGITVLSISATSAFAQNDNVLERADTDSTLNSATLCSIDDGREQNFIRVSSVRQCFDAVNQYTRGYASTEGAAYNSDEEIVLKFACTNESAVSGNYREMVCESI